MTLEEEIAEAQSCIADPPKNESNTCEWIILPLLWAAGYARRDIESRMADNGGKFPDYTLLSSTPATWYLEAKAWNVSLEDSHAHQALNYANHNGKRFVVLTNGQTWRLYDNTVLGLIADKLITSVTLLDTGALTTFLTALSKTEVLSGGLERYVEKVSEQKKREALERQQQAEGEAVARRARERQAELLALLHSTLPGLLNDVESDLIQSITLELSEIEEFKGIKAEMVTRWFSEIFSPSPQSREVPSVSIEKRTPPPIFSIVNGDRTLNLQDMQNVPIEGYSEKPSALHLPD
ncbi:MAG: type I restriction enzyme HsdR N-terminal domain-containing protein [Armatimonadetes bacterium]|nr:type I restriction enzyme HsdR N-terminal domain-containing protein [Armatimonadota bacterium]